MRLGIHPACDCAAIASLLCSMDAGGYYERASEGIDYAYLRQSNFAFL